MTSRVPARRVPAVLAGVLAMLASLTALGAIVASDIAEASAAPTEVLSDEVSPTTPVKVELKKYEVPEEVDMLDGYGGLGLLQNARFGHMEGY